MFIRIHKLADVKMVTGMGREVGLTLTRDIHDENEREVYVRIGKEFLRCSSVET